MKVLRKTFRETPYCEPAYYRERLWHIPILVSIEPSWLDRDKHASIKLTDMYTQSPALMFYYYGNTTTAKLKGLKCTRLLLEAGADPTIYAILRDKDKSSVHNQLRADLVNFVRVSKNKGQFTPY